tara:strand:+ start:162 stop:476 length:315 start_codon:yes stop_codon:yes gene_type:complete
MGDKKDKKFDYKEELIDKIPEEFRPDEKPSYDPDNLSIQDLMDISDFVPIVLKTLPKEHHDVYLAFVNSLVKKNQVYLDAVREKFKDKELVLGIIKNLATKKRN